MKITCAARAHAAVTSARPALASLRNERTTGVDQTASSVAHSSSDVLPSHATGARPAAQQFVRAVAINARSTQQHSSPFVLHARGQQRAASPINHRPASQNRPATSHQSRGQRAMVSRETQRARDVVVAAAHGGGPATCFPIFVSRSEKLRLDTIWHYRMIRSENHGSDTTVGDPDHAPRVFQKNTLLALVPGSNRNYKNAGSSRPETIFRRSGGGGERRTASA
ncbi:nuclear-pore anchor-like [Dorcoceras hygrometricum]|uniref:Nuclear-pore anchor-like n=1 Tax=Dorcoceras hygrometricum TaxID=472368 RepID=A0A2Z7BTS8_9LAMI|nr:nuclear-pore anchor-like [Dorcoceras hygrometricum]